MIRVALCGPIAFQGSDLAAFVEDLVTKLGPEPPLVQTFGSPTELIDACMSISEGDQPVDLIIAGQALAGITGIQVANELRQNGLLESGLQFVLCAGDGARAADAAKVGIAGYLIEPVDERNLLRVVTPLLDTLEQLHECSTVLRCREGVRRIPFSQITHVETTGRDQTIHRRDAEPLSVRCSSRALFAHLQKDQRFYKLGSSYIINLDFVDSLQMRSGMVTMLDGTSVPAPVRLRTELADAICSHAAAAV